MEFQEEDMSNPHFHIGMIFKDHKQFREALYKRAILDGRDLTMVKNDSSRITAKCKSGCGWRIHASKPSGHQCFIVKTFQPKHNCGKTYHNSLINSEWLSKEFEDYFRDNHGCKPKAFQNTVHTTIKANISRWQAYRAKVKANSRIEGLHGEQYRKVRQYAETLIQYNPGSTAIISTEEDSSLAEGVNRFLRFYVCLDACRKGFVEACRPFISIDACFLKTSFGGQLFVAIEKDANNNFFPIAYAVTESECKDSWIWFLEILKHDIGDNNDHGWVFMSDRQKGLRDAVETVFPGSEHRFCMRHIYKNFCDRGYRGKALKDILWRPAIAYTKPYFDSAINSLKDKNKGAYDYVMREPVGNWARYTFTGMGCTDLVVNNLSEGFNAYVLDAREAPLVTMLESIRVNLMKGFHQKRDGIQTYKDHITPYARKKVECAKNEANTCKIEGAGNGIWEVKTRSNKVKVDLRICSCTCRQWDLSGIPCKHAVSAIYGQRENPEDYVSDYYRTTTWLKAYQHMIHPIPSEEHWVQSVGNHEIKPPYPRKQAGRPRKKRIRGNDEDLQSNHKRIRILTTKCRNCNKLGHNSRTCKEPQDPNTDIMTQSRTVSSLPTSQSSPSPTIRLGSPRVRLPRSSPVLRSGSPMPQPSSNSVFGASSAENLVPIMVNNNYSCGIIYQNPSKVAKLMPYRGRGHGKTITRNGGRKNSTNLQHID